MLLDEASGTVCHSSSPFKSVCLVRQGEESRAQTLSQNSMMTLHPSVSSSLGAWKVVGSRSEESVGFSGGQVPVVHSMVDIVNGIGGAMLHLHHASGQD